MKAKRFRICLASATIASLAAIFLSASTAHASLVGDQIFIDRLIPTSPGGPFSFCQENNGTGPQGCAVTVAEGNSDRLALTGGNNLFVDVDAAQIRIDFGPEFGAGGPFAEHLIVFNDLDFLGANSVLSGFTFDSDLAGMDASLISFADHSFAVNYANLSYSGGEYLTIFLLTKTIPEPSTLALISATCLCLALGGRNKRSLSSSA